MKVPAKKVTLKNNKEVILRSPLPSEADLMLAHLKITAKESYINLIRPSHYWETVSIEEEAKVLTTLQDSKDRFMIAAFYENRIVGSLGLVGEQLEFTKHCASLGMGIQKEFSNCRLGTEMMKYSLALAQEMNFHRIGLSVRTYNEAGIKLYENMGFERIGHLKHVARIDEKYVDEYSYQLILD